MKKTILGLAFTCLVSTTPTLCHSAAVLTPYIQQAETDTDEPDRSATDAAEALDEDDSNSDDSNKKNDQDSADSPKNDQESNDQENDRNQSDEVDPNDEEVEPGDGDDENETQDESSDEPDAEQGDDNQNEDGQESDDQKGDDDRSTHTANPLSIFGGSSAAEEAYSKRSVEFIGVFKPVIASAATSTVKVMSGRRQLALGIVVDADGYILTKASELKSNLSCKLPNGQSLPAQVYGIHPETDLAMLKIEANNLSPIQWSDEPTPTVGHWLATPNGQKTILDVGIVGVNSRVIPPSSPFIGIGPPRVTGDTVGAKIDTVVANSPADEFDLMVGDVITHIDDVEIKDWETLRKTLGQYDAGDRITITLTRAGKVKKIKLNLAERDKISPQNDRSNQQNSMGSVLSRRRKDFPDAFQHDSMLTANTCGGPVVNLDGQVVGVNIARAGRVDSLALPVAVVRPVIELLKTGELAPAIVNKVRLTQIDVELQELKQKMTDLPDKKLTLEAQYNIEKAKQEELEKILNDVQDRLKVIELKSKNFGTELDSVKGELKSIKKVREKLEADRKLLSTGLR